MIVIFLDIDGVLYNLLGSELHTARIRERYREQGRELPKLGCTFSDKDCDEAAVDLFNKSAVANLELLIKSIEENGDQVGIVLSSAWREKGDVSYLKTLFGQYHFSNYIFDKTIDRHTYKKNADKLKDIFGNRHLEIMHWLEKNSSDYHVKDFLIIDDLDDDLSKNFGNNFIHCETLLTSNEVAQALTSLKIHSPTKSSKHKCTIL